MYIIYYISYKLISFINMNHLGHESTFASVNHVGGLPGLAIVKSPCPLINCIEYVLCYQSAREWNKRLAKFQTSC